VDAIKNIIASTDEESLEKMLSPLIREQFPAFMREDYSKLILLVKAYYEWLEQSGNAGNVLSNIDTIYDVDANEDEFYTHFSNTYLASFPDLLAENSSGNKPNKKTLLKKIRDFYGNKGTESAYKFLFRVLYDSDVEFYYPKTDIIKASDGQWIEPKSIKTTVNNGSALFGAKGGQIIQTRGSETVASAFVDSVIQYTFNGAPVCEFFLSDIIGDFVPELPVKILKDGAEWQETAYSVLGEFFIELPGDGYRVGDSVTLIDPVGGSGLSAKVEQVGLAGGIKRISITNSGLNYAADAVVSIFNDSGRQSAKVIALRTAITNYPGYYGSNRGKVSSDKSIYDGHYYQDFSYQLKSAVSLGTYFDVLSKLIHPVGMRMFGSVLLKASVDNQISTSAQGMFSKTPLIGQYTPYAPRTYNNLRNGIFLPNQVRGATLQVWLSAYTIEGNSATGVTANTSPLGNTASIAFGVNRFVDLARGVTYTVPNGNAAETTVWSVPRFKQEAINTHASLVLRPINERGSDFDGTHLSSWRSYGYWSGLTVGALGLSAARSYFVVAKGRTGTTMGALGTATTSRYLVSDVGGHHGIVVGTTGGTSTLRAIAYNNASPIASNNIVGTISGGVGEWFVVCSTYNGTPAANGALSLFVNGVCAGTQASSGQNSLVSGQTLAVGMASGIDSVFDGEIAEVICYQGDVGKADREKVEGYLAHKYGLAGKLPSTHPFKNTVPGGSYSSGRWYGNTGDYYPLGYNPYIGSTTEVGRDGTTAPLGSLFVDSGLGYTFTVANEHGITSHNPTGSPLGSTAAWWDNGASGSNKETALDPSHIRGLALWLRPENIGVCGSVANGRSADVWRDASPFQNHALPPTWGRFNGSGYASAGVTIDKLRPVLSVGSLAGPTGVCFNGGVLYAPTTVWNGASLAQWIQMGNTHGAGTTAERILTGQHLYLTNPLNLPDEADIFVVMRPTVDGYDKGLGLFSSDAGLTAYRRDDTVLYHRSYNPVDRNTALANSAYYRVLPNGSLLYPSVAPSGLVGFRPSGSKTGVQQNTIAYDPHVSGVCFGVAVGEWRRDSSRRIESFLNGDESKNYSLASGRRIAAVNTPNSDDYLIKNGLVMWLDAGNTVSYPGSGTTWFDLSGQGNNGTLVGGVQYSNENSGAFVFDGINDHVTFANPLNQSQMQQVWTVQGWINITTKPSQVFISGLNSGLWVEYSQGNNSLLYLNSGTNDYYTYGGQFTAQGWVLCTFRFNNSTADRQIWRNVTNISTGGPNQTTTPLGQSSTFVLGASNASTIKGRVSNLMIYNRYLSDVEIQQNFNVLRNRYGV
jgi:hypothetical protein